MNDLIDLAYELGNLIDSMPEFDADSIYYTCEDNNGDEVELRFNLTTGKWSSSDATKKVFSFRSRLDVVFANNLMSRMTKTWEENNDD